MDPKGEEEGRTKPEKGMVSCFDQPGQATVETGVYIDRIVEISTKATSWTVDFYIWFKWNNPKLKPGGNFQVVDGEILPNTDRVEIVRQPQAKIAAK